MLWALPRRDLPLHMPGKVVQDGLPASALLLFGMAGLAVEGDGDVLLGGERQRAAAQIRATGMPIGALINVAGGFRWETVQDGSVESWDWLYETNVKTALITCREFLPDLAKTGAGRIVNVGAAAAAKAGAGMGAYAASKSAVLRLTEALAEEWKDAGVAVNAVLPSIIDTPANRASMPDADFTKWVAPDALADAVAFLVSPGARAITGAGIPVTGRV